MINIFFKVVFLKRIQLIYQACILNDLDDLFLDFADMILILDLLIEIHLIIRFLKLLNVFRENKNLRLLRSRNVEWMECIYLIIGDS